MPYVSPTHGLNGWFWGGVFLSVLQWVCVLIRCYIRIFLVKKFGADDWALIATLAAATAFEVQLATVAVLSRQASIGQFPPRYVKPSVDLIQGCELAYIIAAALLKVTLGLLLLRVIGSRWMRYTIYTIMSITTVYGLFFFFFILFQCGDPQHFARKIIAEGRCLSDTAILSTSYVHALVTALADVALALLSAIFVWTSALGQRAKFSVGGILILGSVGCILTFARIGWIHYLVRPKTEYFVKAQGISIMSLAELAIGIICISLVTYKPLFQRFFPATRNSYYGSNQQTPAASSQPGQSTQEGSSLQSFRADRDSKSNVRSSAGSESLVSPWPTGQKGQEEPNVKVTAIPEEV